MVQSNNATYGGTGQIEQQFAITRARAMEIRRGNRGGHHEQRLWFHHARWSGCRALRSSQHRAWWSICAPRALTPAVRVAHGWSSLALVAIAGLPRCRTRVARRRAEEERPDTLAASDDEVRGLQRDAR